LAAFRHRSSRVDDVEQIVGEKAAALLLAPLLGRDEKSRHALVNLAADRDSEREDFEW